MGSKKRRRSVLQRDVCEREVADGSRLAATDDHERLRHHCLELTVGWRPSVRLVADVVQLALEGIEVPFTACAVATCFKLRKDRAGLVS